MGMKAITITIILIGIVLLIIGISTNNPSTTVTGSVIDNKGNEILSESHDEHTHEDGTHSIVPSLSVFEFEGFAPANIKSHVGTFDSFEGTLTLQDKKLTEMQGTVQVSSIETGIGGLNTHLLSSDFFDSEKFPTIEFESTSILNGQLSGDLTFHGVTAPITFPVTTTPNSISGEFTFDTLPHNFKNIKAKEEVRIAFNFVI
jgi:hypothetical protein